MDSTVKVTVEASSPEALSAAASVICAAATRTSRMDLLDALSEAAPDGNSGLHTMTLTFEEGPVKQPRSKSAPPSKPELEAPIGPPSPEPPMSEPVSGAVSPQFILSTCGARAMGRWINGKFVVIMGSTARKRGAASWRTCRALRDQLVADGKLAQDDFEDCLYFTEDVEFDSPTAAASVVEGGNADGPRDWKLVDTLETYESWRKRVEKASNDHERKFETG